MSEIAAAAETQVQDPVQAQDNTEVASSSAEEHEEEHHEEDHEEESVPNQNAPLIFEIEELFRSGSLYLKPKTENQQFAYAYTTVKQVGPDGKEITVEKRCPTVRLPEGTFSIMQHSKSKANKGLKNEQRTWSTSDKDKFTFSFTIPESLNKATGMVIEHLIADIEAHPEVAKSLITTADDKKKAFDAQGKIKPMYLVNVFGNPAKDGEVKLNKDTKAVETGPDGQPLHWDPKILSSAANCNGHPAITVYDPNSSTPNEAVYMVVPTTKYNKKVFSEVVSKKRSSPSSESGDEPPKKKGPGGASAAADDQWIVEEADNYVKIIKKDFNIFAYQGKVTPILDIIGVNMVNSKMNFVMKPRVLKKAKQNANSSRPIELLDPSML